MSTPPTTFRPIGDAAAAVLAKLKPVQAPPSKEPRRG
jgi:hypothetical protein